MSETNISLSAWFDLSFEGFIEYSEDVDLPYSANFFHNCSGDALYEINAALSFEDSMRANMLSLWGLTRDYLTVAKNNIEDCELDNT